MKKFQTCITVVNLAILSVLIIGAVDQEDKIFKNVFAEQFVLSKPGGGAIGYIGSENGNIKISLFNDREKPVLIMSANDQGVPVIHLYNGQDMNGSLSFSPSPGGGSTLFMFGPGKSKTAMGVTDTGLPSFASWNTEGKMIWTSPPK